MLRNEFNYCQWSLRRFYTFATLFHRPFKSNHYRDRLVPAYHIFSLSLAANDGNRDSAQARPKESALTRHLKSGHHADLPWRNMEQEEPWALISSRLFIRLLPSVGSQHLWTPVSQN